MIDPKRQSELDQSFALWGDEFPKLWRRIYENLIAGGFTKEESLHLLCVYINTSHRQSVT